MTAVVATAAVAAGLMRSPAIKGFDVPPCHLTLPIQAPQPLSSLLMMQASCLPHCPGPPLSTLLPLSSSPASDGRKVDRQCNHLSEMGRGAPDREKSDCGLGRLRQRQRRERRGILSKKNNKNNLLSSEVFFFALVLHRISTFSSC